MTKPQNHILVGAGLTLALLFGRTPPAAGQSAAEVFRTALQRYEDATEGIQSYTVVQEVMGVESRTTFERRTVDGRSALVPADAGDGGGWSSVPAAYGRLAERARLEGEDTVEGNACWVAVVDDFEGLDLGSGMNPQSSGGFTPTKGTFYIDRESYLLRKLIMEGEVRQDGEASPMTMESVLGDYRTVEGWDYPFRIDVTIRGVPTGMSPEEAAETRKKMAELEEQLASMPEGQKAMVERMMKPQIERLRTMLDSGTLEGAVVTKELTVNR